jgi:hypothetical protein
MWIQEKSEYKVFSIFRSYVRLFGTLTGRGAELQTLSGFSARTLGSSERSREPMRSTLCRVNGMLLVNLIEWVCSHCPQYA